jgi:two-component system, OmpR family, response regulator VanR
MQPMKHRSRILVIDDEPACNFKLCTFLRDYFDEVYSASDGLEGWQMYLLHLPDTVISDINMPRLSGPEFVKRVRKSDQECFLILMTAYSDEQHIEKIANLRINHYFIKPFTSDKLSLLINRIRSTQRKQLQQRVQIYDSYWYDPLSKTIRCDTLQIRLSHKEIILMETFLEYPDKIVTYDMFYERLADTDTTSLNALRILIGRIRKKIPNIPIKSIYKIGYILTS